jgi:hypothetical protein
MAQYDDKSEEVSIERMNIFTARFCILSKIRTRLLSDPTLLSYYKWMNDRRTLSSLGCRNQTPKIVDPRRVVSEQGFRYYHRTATPFSNGRTSRSALSWQAHDQTNIESPVRRLARFSFLLHISFIFEILFVVLNVIILNKNHKIQLISIQLIDLYHTYIIVRHPYHLLSRLEIAHQRINLTSEMTFSCS